MNLNPRSKYSLYTAQGTMMEGFEPIKSPSSYGDRHDIRLQSPTIYFNYPIGHVYNPTIIMDNPVIELGAADVHRLREVIINTTDRSRTALPPNYNLPQPAARNPSSANILLNKPRLNVVSPIVYMHSPTIRMNNLQFQLV